MRRQDEDLVAQALGAVADPVEAEGGVPEDRLCEIVTLSLAERAECDVARRRAAARGGSAILQLLGAGWSFRRIHVRTGAAKATAGRWIDIYRTEAAAARQR